MRNPARGAALGSSTISEKIRKQLAALPARPGVYIMRNAKGEVIYVGKAAKLQNRVRIYFGSPHMMEPKTRALLGQIEDFEYIVVGNAGEALHLEATLVKRHQPFFNIRLKDDKHYPYLKIDLQNPWPRVYITRRVEKDGARYFGPYANAGSVRRDAGHRQEALPVALVHEDDHRHGPAALPGLLHQPLHRALHELLHQGGVRRGHRAGDPVPRRARRTTCCGG